MYNSTHSIHSIPNLENTNTYRYEICWHIKALLMAIFVCNRLEYCVH